MHFYFLSLKDRIIFATLLSIKYVFGEWSAGCCCTGMSPLKWYFDILF